MKWNNCSIDIKVLDNPTFVFLEYVVICLIIFVIIAFLLTNEWERKDTKKNLVFILPFLTVIILYYLFSPYQNCMREFDIRDFKRGCSLISLQELNKSYCDTTENW